MNLVFLGPPGSGKGTQAKKLAEKLGYVHLSTGDVLRKAVKDGTELGRKADGFMQAGELVPDELIIGMIEELVSAGALKNGFILDGFPRTIPQAESLDIMFEKYKIKLDKAVLLHVGDAEVTKRLLGRAEIEGRADDNAEVIKNRIEIYKKQTAPIEQFYRGQSILTEVKGEDTPENVFEALLKVAK
ncbi:MAG: adenylate kinase [candidate division Zixibacteria bacterium]|nr:adenylate kinase [candidate division Zixibacteria bacterium]